MRFFKYFLLLFIALWFSSCKIFRSNLMLKTPKDYTFDKIADSLARQDYKIDVNDILNIRIFANDGFKIVDLATSNQVVVFEPVACTIPEIFFSTSFSMDDASQVVQVKLPN